MPGKNVEIKKPGKNAALENEYKEVMKQREKKAANYFASRLLGNVEKTKAVKEGLAGILKTTKVFGNTKGDGRVYLSAEDFLSGENSLGKVKMTFRACDCGGVMGADIEFPKITPTVVNGKEFYNIIYRADIQTMLEGLKMASREGFDIYTQSGDFLVVERDMENWARPRSEWD